MSEIFNNLFSKAKDLADLTGKKAGEIIDVSKIKISIAEINSEIKKNHEEIGKLYYDMEINGNDNLALMNTLIEDINQKKEKISNLNERYEELKNVIVCPNCKTKNESESIYCTKCGEKIN
ncbi:MAG: hypothetical protein IKZ25_02410 [Clostridia bacterium]|nr:hypothetical protein [Clostridia bacterium]